jgi:hypothetical protein
MMLDDRQPANEKGLRLKSQLDLHINGGDGTAINV